MSVQNSLNIANVPFILSGNALSRQDAVIAQDAGRVAVLAPFTLMAKVAATQLWTPFISEIATNGTAHPQGIYVGDEIAAADLVAGDVTDAFILLGDAIVDTSMLVIEAAKTLDTVITVGTTDLRTVRDHLACRGIFVEETIEISSFENA